MPNHAFNITDNGGIEITVTDETGATKSATLDPNLEDNLRIGAIDTGGFEMEFPDGQGGRLILKFRPDIANTQLIIEGGRPGGTLLSTTVNFS